MEEQMESREADGSQVEVTESELSALMAKIAELRQGEEARAAEVATLRAELTAARQEQEGELSALRARLVDAQQERLDTHRRALLAEHAGQVVDELVMGSTVEELEASVERARAAYARVAESARRELGATVVPVGASPRVELNPEELSPIAKIAVALNRNR